jgi:hypothetical protein
MLSRDGVSTGYAEETGIPINFGNHGQRFVPHEKLNLADSACIFQVDVRG